MYQYVKNLHKKSLPIKEKYLKSFYSKSVPNIQYKQKIVIEMMNGDRKGKKLI